MPKQQITLFAALLAIVVALLAAVYFLFLRPDYVLLYEDIREEDSSQIISELERVGLGFKLEDGGRRILVPDSALEQARVAIAGADIPMGGVVGFEIFNESDMGLTEFAQQVNFQRALQGELARTIMMMEGVKFARVHISIPEKALFRAQQIGPKAAVTVQADRSEAISDKRVQGIQRLVASAVSELQPQDVAVLDESGRLISMTSDSSFAHNDSLTEKQALEAYFKARALDAAEPILRGSTFDIRVTASSVARTSANAGPNSAVQSIPRNFALRIAVRAPFEINVSDRDELADAIQAAVGFSAATGDTLLFEMADVGPIPDGLIPAASESGSFQAQQSHVDTSNIRSSVIDLLWSRWTILGIIIIAVVGQSLWRRRKRMSPDEHKAFAGELAEILEQRRDERHA